MRTIITGTRGFIGTHLEAMAKKTLDITHFMNDRKAEIIFSIASGAEVSESLEQPRKFIRNNVDLIIDLLECARNMPKLKHFIHLSTSEVYGPREDGDICTEWNSPTVTHSPYSASKAAQESILMAYWKSYGVPVTIVNTMNVFGEHQQPNKFIPSTVRKIKAGEEIILHAKNGVMSQRQYVHADCVSSALIHAAGLPYSPSENRPQRFHVAGEVEVSMGHIATEIAKIVTEGYFKFRVEEPTRPGHGGRYALDGARPQGWTQPMTFQESLERTVRFIASS